MSDKPIHFGCGGEIEIKTNPLIGGTYERCNKCNALGNKLKRSTLAASIVSLQKAVANAYAISPLTPDCRNPQWNPAEAFEPCTQKFLNEYQHIWKGE
tara:strand:- start:4948 stop:5241 length:294 start_codon:yes stop_codon:yes gene_type:complete